MRITRVRLPPAYFSICTSTGKPLRQRGARVFFLVEREELAGGVEDVAPDALVVFDLDLELHAVRPVTGDQPGVRDCSAWMRSSIGGCVENSAMMPARSVMPNPAIVLGSVPGSTPPRRFSALTIGVGEPRY